MRAQFLTNRRALHTQVAVTGADPGFCCKCFAGMKTVKCPRRAAKGTAREEEQSGGPRKDRGSERADRKDRPMWWSWVYCPEGK